MRLLVMEGVLVGEAVYWAACSGVGKIHSSMPMARAYVDHTCRLLSYRRRIVNQAVVNPITASDVASRNSSACNVNARFIILRRYSNVSNSVPKCSADAISCTCTSTSRHIHPPAASQFCSARCALDAPHRRRCVHA